ncbi:MAG: flavin reductase family protein [Armatimonadota bacterium]
MAKREVPYTAGFDTFCDTLHASGLLLVSLDAGGRPNAMTIGWAMLGVVWRRPICAVFVRPSRYTYECLEATGDFTVNVPPSELAEEVLFCGTHSGRDHDKFAECGFTAEPGRAARSPGIAQCPITYECTVVQKNDVTPEHFIPQIIATLYARGDFHRVYYGEILATWADVDRLASAQG